ncbi:Bug family tripartite tricarboxylate transporter substrate binding protein [Pseudorhodoferax soli]|uniref:Tripartite-type tricarboxylate transporter receptor subunit TctC n=1 Tax=Pseudorhodoferax soli TaxID=545864 RepID=A0A368XNA2_9BURK|nr:tripartite tricarboxylate transporter substrate binding protein [Pseudorhodoferax soli]RCW68656.1 tripartite-type tricarboxylate transporter receptor subunit TctC [Pseudorhodoferax soli]
MKLSAMTYLSSIALSALVWAQPAAADTWPSKPVTIVVPYTPGGLADQMARMSAQHLSKAFGQPFIIDNKPGAGTVIGSQFVARAKPDGYTLLLGGTPNIYMTQLYKKAAVKREDLAPVASLITVTNYLVVNPKSKYQSLQDVIKQSKADPGSVSCANYGIGTSGHLSCELLSKAAGIQLTNVAYKGGMPTIQDTLAGQVDMAVVVEALPFITEKTLRGLAVTTSSRNPYAPSIPTLAESYPGFDVTSFEGFFAPAGTPVEIMRRISAEVQVAMKDAHNLARMKDLGVVPMNSNYDDFAAYYDQQYQRWNEILKPMNITLD